MARVYTEKQEAFLNALVELGNYTDAKKAAGYSPSTIYRDIIVDEEMASEVKRRLSQYMILHAPQAVKSLVELMENPATIGGAIKRGSATDILDRVGLSKQDSLEVTIKQPDGIIVLPTKKEIDHEALLAENS
jgi:hypothetical protein